MFELIQIVKLLSTSLDKLALEKEKLLQANKALEKALEEEHGRVVKLTEMISVESAEKLVLTRKLEEANSKLSKMKNADGRLRRIYEGVPNGRV